MAGFRWLHLSDLHFQMCKGFDMSLIPDQLKEKLNSLAENGKFRFVFLTGDLANCPDDSAIEENIEKLILHNDLLEEDGRIFRACGMAGYAPGSENMI